MQPLITTTGEGNGLLSSSRNGLPTCFIEMVKPEHRVITLESTNLPDSKGDLHTYIIKNPLDIITINKHETYIYIHSLNLWFVGVMFVCSICLIHVERSPECCWIRAYLGQARGLSMCLAKWGTTAYELRVASTFMFVDPYAYPMWNQSARTLRPSFITLQSPITQVTWYFSPLQ